MVLPKKNNCAKNKPVLEIKKLEVILVKIKVDVKIIDQAWIDVYRSLPEANIGYDVGDYPKWASDTSKEIELKEDEFLLITISEDKEPKKAFIYPKLEKPEK